VVRRHAMSVRLRRDIAHEPVGGCAAPVVPDATSGWNCFTGSVCVAAGRVQKSLFSRSGKSPMVWTKRRLRGVKAASRGQGRFPVFATCPVVILAHVQTITDQGEKENRDCGFYSPRRTSSMASSPWPQSRFAPGPCNQDPNGAACCSLVAQAPGQKGAIIPNSSEPRRVDTIPLTTGAPLPVWGYEAGDLIMPSR
jgi:hypothetical protein